MKHVSADLGFMFIDYNLKRLMNIMGIEKLIEVLALVSLNSFNILHENYHKRYLFTPIYIKFCFQENHTFASSLKKSSYF
jgi:hypothetical protein